MYNMSVKITVLTVVGVIALAHGFSLLQFLQLEDDGAKLIQVPERRADQPNRNCLCKGPACVCCVEFNITFVNMGGPGCVHMRYISPEEGFSVNLSYGKSVLHNSKIKGSNPEAVCLQVFDKFAEVCAKFSDMAPTADGLRGCLQLEPRFLGQTQLEFPIGCFKSKAGGMEIEDPPAVTEEPTTVTPETEEETEEETVTFSAQTFIDSIYQTAEIGLALVSNLLDLPKRNTTKPIEPESTTLQPESSSSSETQRSAKSFKHPNQL